MRSASSILIAASLLLVVASEASGFAFEARLNPASADTSGLLAVSDSVILDVYMDADPGLQILSVVLLYDDNGTLAFDQAASSVPASVLDSGPTDPYLEPVGTQPRLWNGLNLPGKKQVMLEWLTSAADTAFDPVPASGTDIWIGTIVFRVAGTLPAMIELTPDGEPGTSVVYAYGADETANASFSGAFNVLVPEPASGLLLGAALLAFGGRRGARRR